MTCFNSREQITKPPKLMCLECDVREMEHLKRGLRDQQGPNHAGLGS